MAAAPRLADVHCEKIQFQPGDRVLVNVYVHIDEATGKKLVKTVQRWAGEDVEVLVVDNTKMRVSIEQRT